MQQLIYVSKAVRSFSSADMKALLTGSRLRNAAVEVTGHLIFDGEHFLQALEGDDVAVRATMDRVRKDDRHSNIDIIHHAETPTRLFGEWSMGFEDRSATAPIRKGFVAFSGNIPLTELTASSAITLLQDSIRMSP
jgi:hypothetical protein